MNKPLDDSSGGSVFYPNPSFSKLRPALLRRHDQLAKVLSNFMLAYRKYFIAVIIWTAILLTGATGFLGVSLVRELLERSRAVLFCLGRAGTDARARLLNSLEATGVETRASDSRIFSINVMQLLCKTDCPANNEESDMKRLTNSQRPSG
jgi:hypothetical protein